MSHITPETNQAIVTEHFTAIMETQEKLIITRLEDDSIFPLSGTVAAKYFRKLAHKYAISTEQFETKCAGLHFEFYQQ